MIESVLLILLIQLKQFSKGTTVFSNNRRKDIFNVLTNISSIGVLVCLPYIFVVCRLANGYVTLDTHVIQFQLGENGIVITFPNTENCLSWIIQRSSFQRIVKGSDWQKLYEFPFLQKKEINSFLIEGI